MGTVIFIIIAAVLSVLLLLWDTLRKRELIGDNPREYFGHPFDYELGWRLVFTKLPRIPYAGTLITYVLFFFLLLYVPPMIGSTLHGTLMDPQSPEPFVAFFEDPLVPVAAVVTALICYLYRSLFEHVPDAMESIARSRNTQDGSYTISPEAEVQLKSTASFIFQAGNRRRRSWLLLDVLLGVTLIFMVVHYFMGIVRTGNGTLEWSSPGYFWGITGSILHWLILVYFIRLLMSYVIRLSVAMWSIGKILGRKNLLHIEPLHPDGAGGLADFGNLGWRLASLVLPFALVIVFWWYGSVLTGRDVGFWYIPAVIILAVMVPVVFFLPLWGLHTAMAKAKREALDVLSRHFDKNAPAIRRWLEGVGSMTRDEVLTARENIENVSALYEHVSKMPVWPFNTAALVRFGSYMLVVILPALISWLE